MIQQMSEDPSKYGVLYSQSKLTTAEKGTVTVDAEMILYGQRLNLTHRHYCRVQSLLKLHIRLYGIVVYLYLADVRSSNK